MPNLTPESDPPTRKFATNSLDKNLFMQSQRRLYYRFKKQLLLMMANRDPLAILESGIFQRYEQECWHDPLMETVIKSQKIENLSVKIVQRRSLSCEGKAQDAKVHRLMEQSKIDLTIWSNIMHHLLLKLKQQQQQNMINCPKIKIAGPSNKQNCSISSNCSKQKSTPALVNQFEQFLSSCKARAIANPSKKMISMIFNELQTKIEEENDKTISYLNFLRQENDKLHRVNQENSFKELQSLVQVKECEKRIAEKQREIEDLRSRMKEVEGFGRRKNIINELRERIMIDSVRRNTLIGLDRQKTDIELRKEAMGMTEPEDFPTSANAETFPNESFYEEGAEQQTYDT